MKGRTNQPVRVKVYEAWLQHPAIQELHRAGHQIIPVAGDDADVILHPAAHGWHEAMFEQYERKNGEKYRPYLEAAIKAGRQRRRAAK